MSITDVYAHARTLAAELSGTQEDWVEVLKAILNDRPLQVSTAADAAERAREWWKEDQDGTGPVILHNRTPIEFFRALANFQRARVMVAALYAAVGE